MKSYYFLSVIAIVLSACRKGETPGTPTFDAQAASITYHAGDTVQFNLQGDAGIISFYSGEIGNDYDHRTGRIMASRQFLSFQSQMLGGTQPHQLSVLVSTDFDGQYEAANVNAATWHDISDRFRLADFSDNQAYVSSGKQDLTDLLEDGKPLFIAYHYVTLPQTQAGIYNIWRVQNFLLEGVNDVASTTIANHSGAGWKLVLEGDYDANRCKINASNLDLRGNLTHKDASTVAWAISKPFYLVAETDFGPDRAIGIKAVADPVLTSYSYIYSQPGNYTVTFIARNTSIYGSKDVIKQINLTINP